MDENIWLAERFEEHRDRLRAVAHRMLGSTGEADDAVQEGWLRLSRTDPDSVDDLGAWLTTVVARVALDMLRARTARRQDPSGTQPTDPGVEPVAQAGPEDEAATADAVGVALLLVLDTLSPTERLAFVLHDTFAVPFDRIGPILDRSPAAAKQLASRARRKVRGASPDGAVDRVRQRAVVDAFLAASRAGDFEALVELLAPDVVVAADAAAVAMGSPAETRGAADVAGTFSGRALGAQPAAMGDAVGIVWIVGGRPKVAWDLTVVDGRITRMEMVADADALHELDPTPLT